MRSISPDGALLQAQAGLSRYTRLGIGGRADWYFGPGSVQSLARFMAAKPAEMPVTPIGLGSNLLIRDGGVAGVVIRLDGDGCGAITVEGTSITAGAGASARKLCRLAARRGLSGLEFLWGIPGSIGGAIAMNAGAFGHCMADLVTHVDFIDEAGRPHRLGATALEFGYRNARIPPGWIVVGATLRCASASPDAVSRVIHGFETARLAYQPVAGRTAGSTFMNPDGHHARELIADAGCSGLRIGDAWVSDRNPNFFFNLGRARSEDMERLIETVQHRVWERCGLLLQLELRIVGRRQIGAALPQFAGALPC